MSEQTLTRWLRDTEAGTRSRFLHDDFGALSPALRRQELLEAFSHVAVNNATGRYADSALPSPVRTFFRAFKEMIGQHLRIATDFLRLRREGKVDPHFAHWLDVAGGLDPDVHGPLRPEDGSTAKIVDPVRAEDGVSAKDEAFSFSLAESTPERDASPGSAGGMGNGFPQAFVPGCDPSGIQNSPGERSRVMVSEDQGGIAQPELSPVPLLHGHAKDVYKIRVANPRR
ncbi:hypothetical protein [Luteolibacter sp. LG18]|uniref:hypothetical protein n=1 Tax=Luteolibacter sp. LG18 TaxID=2819286 RepID=UPI002B2E8F2C|nr:hypothetical protein llg_26600 [Luteolibacter sp. LG18]